MVLEREIARLEDRVKAIADLELEPTVALPVLVLDGAAEVAVLRVAEVWDREGDAMKWCALGEGPLDLRLEPILVCRVEVDVLREPTRASEDTLAESRTTFEELTSPVRCRDWIDRRAPLR